MWFRCRASCAGAPLTAGGVARVFGLARGAEGHFAAPQDVEWTVRGDELFALQSRPIITLTGEAGDGRATYLTPRRSFESLQRLRRRIEDEDLPALAAEADRLAAVRLEDLDDSGLLAAARERKAAHDRGVDVHEADFIPFAHGVRLFGSAYSDALQPEDPFEFTDLLTATPMLSLRRNAALERVADRLRAGDVTGALRDLDAFGAEFGAMEDAGEDLREQALAVARRLARRPPAARQSRSDPAARAVRFIESYPEPERERAAALLELGRASWRLHDDDNLYIGRLEHLLTGALDEARRRRFEVVAALEPRPVALPSPLGVPASSGGSAPSAAAARDARAARRETGASQVARVPLPPGVRSRVRQIVGQPAGPGLAVGMARVIAGRDDLTAFEDGEILVWDAVQPEMTFIVPLTAGIVERRGGMLIHGAIIAREYGLPCVTGVPGAADLIHTGDRVTVDGYLGIVIVG